MKLNDSGGLPGTIDIGKSADSDKKAVPSPVGGLDEDELETRLANLKK